MRGRFERTALTAVLATVVGLLSGLPVPPAAASVRAAPSRSASPAVAPAVPCDTIYGVVDANSNSRFYRVGTASPYALAALGPTRVGFNFEGIEYSPRDGRLYATTSISNKHGKPGFLYRVNPVTGALAALFSTGFKDVEGLSVRPSNGTLWAWVDGKGLIKIDPASKSASLVQASRLHFEALGWNGAGDKLYLAKQNTLWSWDPSTLAFSQISSSLPGPVLGLDVQDGTGVLALGVASQAKIVLWDPGTQTSVGSIPTPGYKSTQSLAWTFPCSASEADLSITKNDGATTVTPGGSITYTITASNAGPANATGATVADTFPASLTATWTCAGAGGGTCTASGSGNINETVNLPAGGSVTFTVSATLSAAATGTLSNTATVTPPAGTTDPNTGNNSATDSDTMAPQSDLAITKTDGVTSVTAGGSTIYTITASNAGPANATGATVADTFPASLTVTWTCAGAGGGTCTASGSGDISDTVNLPAGGSVTFTASATISSSATGTLSNTATVSAPAGTTDPNPGNNSAIDSDTITGGASEADLSITKNDGATTVTPGGSITYTITASNAGPANATGATVADTFPASLTATWTCAGAGGGTCTASGSGNINETVNLPAGGSVTFTVSATLSAAATGTLSNTATVTPPAGTTDPNTGNNSATDSDTMAPQSDLAITKTDGVTSVTAGGSTIYTITASNAGPANATGATVADTFPASLTVTWTCAGAGGGTCTASGSGDISDTVNLPAGGSVTFTASATISSSATGTLSNTATVSAPAGTTDPNPGNNSAIDSDTITGAGLDPANAGDDAHDVTGNVPIAVPASGVLSNDSGTSIAIESYGATTGAEETTLGASTGTAAGGAVTLHASGAYEYTPPVNFTGPDSFKYVIDNALNQPSTGTVTLTASDRVMVIGSAAAGDCSPPSPCSLAAATGIPAVTSGRDLLFVQAGAYPSASVPLKSGQAIVGQGVSLAQALTDAGITLAADSEPLPSFPATTAPAFSNAGTIVTVAGNNLIEQLTLLNAAGSAIAATNVTTGATIRAITITATGAAGGLVISGTSTGSTFGFSDLAITTATGSALSAVGPGPTAATGGTIKSLGGINTLSSVGGIALLISNTTIASGGVTFQSINANGGTSGIALNNTAALGGLIVAGTGTPGSGGTIQSMTDSGIMGTSTAFLSLTRMLISGNGNAVNEGGLRLTNLSGTGGLFSSTVTGSSEDNVYLRNTTGNLASFSIQGVGCTISDNSSTTGNDGVNMQAAGTATMAVSVFGCTFRGNRTDAIHLDAGDSSLMNAQIVSSTIVAGSPNQGNVGIEVTSASSADMDALVSTNKIGTDGVNPAPLANTGINVFAGGSSTITARVTNNTVHNAGAAASGFGIRTFLSTNATLGAKIDTNTVDNVGLDYGILAESSGALVPGSGERMDVGVTNNNVSVLSGALDAIRVQARNTNTVCARVNTNTTNAGGTTFFGIYLRQVNTATFLLEGLSGPVDPYVAAQNPAAASNSSTGTISTVASCNVPS